MLDIWANAFMIASRNEADAAAADRRREPTARGARARPGWPGAGRARRRPAEDAGADPAR